MVASNVSVNENWSGDRNNVMVGNVLERTIVREVQGSVAELIPPVHWDTISGVSNYPTRAQVANNKSRTAIIASRTEGIKYLFEEEGEVEIPELVVTWYNPQAGKMQKRTLKKVVMVVEPNPDLGMLKTIRDSIMVNNASIEEGEEGTKKPISIFGLSIKEFGIGLILLLLLIYIVYRAYSPLASIILIRRERYRNSEAFYFRKFQKAAREKNSSVAIQCLYRWIDQLQLQEPTLLYFVDTYGAPKLLENLIDIKMWSQARSNYRSGKANNELNPRLWINPTSL